MKSRQRKIFREICIICVILGCLTLVVFSIFGESGWLQLQEKNTRLQTLGAEMSQLEKDNHVLKERIEKLKNDPETVELEIRKRLPRAKPGETVYQKSESENQHVKPN